MLGELPLPEEDMVVISESGDISAQNVPNGRPGNMLSATTY